MTNSKIAELINEDNFKSILINELYALIDEEMLKDDMDCELVDQLVLAIEELENIDETDKVIALPLVLGSTTSLAKRIRHKTNRRNTLIRITACAAAISILFAGTNAYLVNTGDTSLITEVRTLVKKIGNFLTGTITDTESTTESSTESTIIADELSHIELVVADNFKTSYLWQEQLNLDGLQVFVVYKSGEKEEISLDQCSILGYNPTKVGEQTVTVKYNEFIASFNITVSKTEQNDTSTRTITNIECDATNKELIVPKGTENPAVAEKVRYRYVYSDGTFSTWTLCKDAELVSEYDSQLIDTPQVLTYRAPNGMEFTVTVLVYDNTVPEEKEVLRLEVSETPKAMQYYATNLYKCYAYLGEECDFSEFQIKVTYKDGSWEHKTLADSEIKAYGTMTTERPSPYGGYLITFAYGNATVDFKYDVIIRPEIQAWFVNETRWDVYYVGEAPAEYPAENLVTANMTDSNEKIYLDVEVKGYDPNKTGFIELEIYYNGEKLCDYLGGFIYGDTGFAVTSRPITDGEALPGKLNYTPYVTAAKCMGNGKFETYADIKYQLDDEPVNDSSITYQSGTAGELKAMGITSFKVRCVDYAVVEYIISADQKITEYGTYTAEVYVYNTKAEDNGWSYKRDGIAQDLSYTIKVKEQPSYYMVDAPNNIKINIQDIYSEFYDKLHVYAVYEDGRKEEIFDYTVTRYLPSRETTSERLGIFIRYPSGKGQSRYVYVYSDGYEDSFFITVSDYRTDKDNYYAVGEKVPAVRVVFSTAKQEELDSLYTTTNASHILAKWEIEGWDTSTTGEKTATIIYHSPIGDLKATYKYVVIPEFQEHSCSIVFNDENYAYDIRYKLVDGTYKVVHTDTVGRTYEITDYTVLYSNNMPLLSYINPVTNKKETYYAKVEKVAGLCENLKAVRLEDGNIKVSVDCPYYPENGTMLFSVGYPAEKGENYGARYEYIESSTPEVIISPDMLIPDKDYATFFVYAYIVDNETGKKHQVYSGRIDFPLR